MQGTATSKQNQVQYFYIETPQDFTLCMNAVAGIGYSGILTSTIVDGAAAWLLTLNSPTQSVTLEVGQVISWDNIQLTKYPNSDAFLALYTIP